MKIMIVGAGKFGYKLATALAGKGNTIAIMDSDSSVLEKIEDHVDALIIRASGLQIDSLKENRVDNYDLVIVVTESDESNIIIASFAKKLGCRKVIARIRDPEYASHRDFLKETMSIDLIINPELAISRVIIKYLLKSYSFYSEDFAEGRIMMSDTAASTVSSYSGQKIKDLNYPEGILVAAMSRDGEIIIPDGNTEVMENDTMYIVGKKDSMDDFAKNNKDFYLTKSVRKVMILGGGKIGYYLAEKLSEQGILVKIIEQNRERCEYLSEKLHNVLVICGDGTEQDLLEDEDISSMDAFIGVTGLDEENLLMTLLAKQAGVKKVIAKVSKSGFANMSEKLGVDVALSPIDITVGEILRYIGGGQILSVSLLLGGQAEVIEILANDKMPITKKTIAKLGLPKGIIIGAILHEGNVFIPGGNSIIYPGDRFVVFCLASKRKELDKVFNVTGGGFFSELRNRAIGSGKNTAD